MRNRVILLTAALATLTFLVLGGFTSPQPAAYTGVSRPSEVRELAFQFDVIVGVAANVARAAGACTDIVKRIFHRINHIGMLAHGEIIVRAPYSDRLWPVVASKAAGIGVRALVTQNVDEHAVAAFGMEPFDRLFEDVFVIQKTRLPLPCRARVPAKSWPWSAFTRE